LPRRFFSLYSYLLLDSLEGRFHLVQSRVQRIVTRRNLAGYSQGEKSDTQSY
jgi:hypothetical protein